MHREVRIITSGVSSHFIGARRWCTSKKTLLVQNNKKMHQCIFAFMFLFNLWKWCQLNRYILPYFVQCPPLILAPLVNMNKGGCENKSELFILLIFIQKIHKILTYHWSKAIESGGKISLWINAFSSFMLATIMAPNYCDVLFPG